MSRLLRRTALRDLKGITYSAEWMRKLEAAGKFPRRVVLGQNIVAYLEEEIDAWIAAQAAARATPPSVNPAKLNAARANLAKANAVKRERRERKAETQERE